MAASNAPPLMRRALEGCFQPPDRDDLMSELTSSGYKFDSQGRLALEAKADMRRRGLPLPDLADAVAVRGRWSHRCGRTCRFEANDAGRKASP